MYTKTTVFAYKDNYCQKPFKPIAEAYCNDNPTNIHIPFAFVSKLSTIFDPFFELPLSKSG